MTKYYKNVIKITQQYKRTNKITKRRKIALTEIHSTY